MNEPVRASLVVRGASPEEVFAALLDVESFPGWAFGLKGARIVGGQDSLPGSSSSSPSPPRASRTRSPAP